MACMIDSRTVLAVRNLRTSTQFYMNVLGFQRDFGDESGVWSFLSRDSFRVMLGECPDDRPASELGSHSYVAYVTVEGIDSLHQEIAGRGAEVTSEPTTEPWGMREFGLWAVDPDELERYFPEFRPLLGECRFADCAHVDTAGCAIMQAVEDGDISKRRYRSYTTLRDESEGEAILRAGRF